MTKESLCVLLDQMLESARLARSYVDGVTRDDFLADRRTQQAVALNLLVIGEAAARLARNHEAFLQSHPDIPWRSMKGMRNRIAHGYFEIDFEVVWNTALTALPELVYRLPSIRAAAAGEEGSPGSPKQTDDL